ncbi:MAG: DUF2182 domain-containing protein [Alphaproteobacteria bacterium]|nr:DUF2182 domain-containing protein [Alphaproteobacteria bacterium]
MAGLVVTAWAALALWERSPYGRYLDHGDWTQAGLAAGICRVLPAGPTVLPALLYAGGWLLMTAAMMLPTTLPLLGLFRRLTAGRADAARLVGLVVTGYLGVWGLFGLAAHGLDVALHAAAAGSAWITFDGWIVGAAVLALAGAFQFSALKHHCLDRCRTPLSFLMAHWHGIRPHAEALRLGAAHGLYCVGCCWAIMLLMFVVGTGSVGWMLVLGAVMAVEKNAPWGRRLAAPLGLALLGWSAAVIVTNLWQRAV